MNNWDYLKSLSWNPAVNVYFLPPYNLLYSTLSSCLLPDQHGVVNALSIKCQSWELLEMSNVLNWET